MKWLQINLDMCMNMNHLWLILSSVYSVLNYWFGDISQRLVFSDVTFTTDDEELSLVHKISYKYTVQCWMIYNPNPMINMKGTMR